MLPTLRFMFGAALACLLLILTVFGLTATVRLAQQAKVSPFKPARALAYASPEGRSEFDYDGRVRDFEAAASIVPLRRDEPLSGGMPAKPNEPQNEPVTSTKPQEERSKTVPPQEHPVEATASTAAAGEDRLTSAGSAAPAEIEPTDPAGGAVDPNTAGALVANSAGLHEPLSGGALGPVEAQPKTPAAETATIQPEGAAPMTPRPAVQLSEHADLIGPSGIESAESAESALSARPVQPRDARRQKAQKSKAAAHVSKIKNTVAKRKTTLPAANPFVAGIGFPRQQNWSGAAGRIFAAPPATKLTSSQPCSLGSASCPRPLLQTSGSRQASFQRSRTQRALSHPQ